MRTTLTLDDDVAALLKRTTSRTKRGQKEVVNAALREGLKRLVEPPPRRSRFQTHPVALGRCRLATLDDVAEALAVAEEEAFR